MNVRRTSRAIGWENRLIEASQLPPPRMEGIWQREGGGDSHASVAFEGDGERPRRTTRNLWERGDTILDNNKSTVAEGSRTQGHWNKLSPYRKRRHKLPPGSINKLRSAYSRRRLQRSFPPRRFDRLIIPVRKEKKSERKSNATKTQKGEKQFSHWSDIKKENYNNRRMGRPWRTRGTDSRVIFSPHVCWTDLFYPLRPHNEEKREVSH
jgi:hypothetical protein